MEYRDTPRRGPVVWDSARSWHSLSREVLSNTFCSWLMRFTARLPNQTTAVSSFYILFALGKMLNLQKICKNSTKNSHTYFAQGTQRLFQVSPIVPKRYLFDQFRMSVVPSWHFCLTSLNLEQFFGVSSTCMTLMWWSQAFVECFLIWNICRMFLNLSAISSSLSAYYIYFI